MSLTGAVELSEVMHQLGPEQGTFRETLLRLAEGAATTDDVPLVRTRIIDDGVVGGEADCLSDTPTSFLRTGPPINETESPCTRMGTIIARNNEYHTIAIASDVCTPTSP